MPRPPSRDRVLRALVFASGAAGLAYEVSWSRQLGLTFGQTARAAAVVLGAYFLGMAVGYALAGARSARMRTPLAGFAVAELVVGAWAFVVPSLIGLAPPHLTEPLARAGVAVLVLLPGTTALGASLPFVAQAAAGGQSDGTARVAEVYAANLAGAVLGVVASTAMLAPVGVVATSRLAAVVSISVGALAWALRGRFAAEPTPPVAGAARTDGLWLAAAALSGFGALAAQVLHVRLFSLLFHNSTYTFAAILLVVLVALSVASGLAARLLRRFDPRAALAGACLAVAGSLPLSAALFARLQGFRYFGFGDSFASYMVAATGLVVAVVLVPVLAMGVVLPLAWHLAGADDRPGPVVGRLTTANTVSAAVGATATSFVLVPLLDLWWSFALIAAAYLGLAAVVARGLPSRRRWAGGLAAAAAVAFGSTVAAVGVDGLKEGEVLIERFAGPYGWTDVTTDAKGYQRRLRQNLHYGLGSRSSSPMQLRQGHLPLLLHPDPKRVAFVGLATGVTASSALDRPEVEQITVMELIPEVVDGARLFAKENAGLLDDPRVRVRVGDGRNVLGSATEQYDVVVADLFVPWESKTGYLYTVEHFAAVRERLAPGGVFCQWLAGWQVGPDEFEAIAQSLAEAFPHVSVWQLGRSADRSLLALVAVEQPTTRSRASMQAAIEQHRPPARGKERVLRSADDVVARYLGDWVSREGVPLNTDEHPIVEFSAPVTSRQKSKRLRRAGYHAYAERVFDQLPREVFTFDPPAGDDERATLR